MAGKGPSSLPVRLTSGTSELARMGFVVSGLVLAAGSFYGQPYIKLNYPQYKIIVNFQSEK